MRQLLTAIRNLPTRVKLAALVLNVLWLMLFSVFPAAAILLAVFGALFWSVFTIINYLTER